MHGRSCHVAADLKSPHLTIGSADVQAAPHLFPARHRGAGAAGSEGRRPDLHDNGNGNGNGNGDGNGNGNRL